MRHNLWYDINKYRHFYFFISPFLIMFAVFMAFPIFFSFYISFFEWGGIGEKLFVGFKNYVELWNDPLFWKALWNTLYIGIIHVPIELLGALVLAVAVNLSYLKYRAFFRGAYFLPVVTSMVVVGLVFSLLLDYDYGLLNYALEKIGLPRIPWLKSMTWSKPSLIILLLWRWTGYVMVLMLAGLQTIPTELYEAAIIDGASPVRFFFKITIPLMKPVILFCFVMATIGTFSLFTEPYVLTQGGPLNSSLTIGLYLYQQGFQFFKFGLASSIAYVAFVLTLAFSLIQMKYLRSEGS